jgi:hypothetical protein
MGNRAVITKAPFNPENVGIYVHWNGGRDSVEGFLKYCELRGFRGFPDDYGVARLTQVISNYFGKDGLSVGVDVCSRLDTDGDNGTYLVEGWEIVGRVNYDNYREQKEYGLLEMLREINNQQPEEQRLTEEQLIEGVNK